MSNFDSIRALNAFAVERHREAIDLSANLGVVVRGLQAPTPPVNLPASMSAPNDGFMGPQVRGPSQPTAGTPPNVLSQQPFSMAAPSPLATPTPPVSTPLGLPDFQDLFRGPQARRPTGMPVLPQGAVNMPQPSQLVPDTSETFLPNRPSSLGGPTASGPTANMSARGSQNLSLINRESGGNWGARNDVDGAGGRGHFGRLQFSRARLEDAKRAGVMPQDMTPEQFLDNPMVQARVEEWHEEDLLRQFRQNGLHHYLGKEIKGTPVTVTGYLNAAHLGGAGGAKKFIESGGEYNPSDANGTSLNDYFQMGAVTDKELSFGNDPVLDIAAALGEDVAPAGATPEQQQNIEEKLGGIFEELMEEQTVEGATARFSKENFDLGGLLEGLGRGFSQMASGQPVDLSAIAERQERRAMVKAQEKRQLEQRRAAASIAAAGGDDAAAQAILRGGIDFRDYLTKRQMDEATSRANSQLLREAQQRGALGTYLARNKERFNLTDDDIAIAATTGDFGTMSAMLSREEDALELAREVQNVERRELANQTLADSWSESDDPLRREAAEIWYAQGDPAQSVMDIWKDLGSRSRGEEQIAALQELGFSRSDAVDAAYDREIAGDRIVRRSTGEPVTPRTTSAFPVTANDPGADAILTSPGTMSLHDNAQNLTGFKPIALQVWNGTIGQFFPGAVVPEVDRARTTLSLAQRNLIESMALSDRYAVGEQNMIKEAMSLEPGMFLAPESMRNSMQTVDAYLRSLRLREARVAQDPGRPGDERNAASRSAVNIDFFLENILQVPPDKRSILGQVPVVFSLSDVDKLSPSAGDLFRMSDKGENRFIFIGEDGKPMSVDEPTVRELLRRENQ